ncbi:MAG TPA: Vitamin B12 dependent methionine synthase activation subunit [Candidatus Mediterraneibacter colneyensis]|nr:Vitamin B12 dependent methionine synthase activation subunit [Candidatus Mediterraneibacter colneyensis]
MERRIREAVRYLGYGKNTADVRTRMMIDKAFSQLEKAAGPRSICRLFDIERKEEGTVQIEHIMIRSSSLGRNLKGCVKAVLFAATLGTEVDQAIRRASVTDMSYALVLQACAAALLEEYCDKKQLEIGEELEKEGLYLRPRFSPGYGDFDIRFQEPFLRMLDCAKTIGLTMTDACMLSPSKSVTAVIGASPVRERCPLAGCEACEKTDCAYRR